MLGLYFTNKIAKGHFMEKIVAFSDWLWGYPIVTLLLVSLIFNIVFRFNSIQTFWLHDETNFWKY